MTRRLLEEFAKAEAKATFFVLGEVVECVPDLIREIHRQGHEIASHSSVHLPPRMIPKSEFKNMLSADVNLLREIIGESPIGFRAPYFDVRRDEGWILDVLSECGFVYDSSVVPTWTPFWGIPWAPKTPYFPDTSDLSKTRPNGRILEIPVTVWPTFGALPGLPMGGGFYMRAWPLRVLIEMMRMNVRDGHRLVIYVHPGDIDDRKDCIGDITLRDSLTQYLVSGRGPRAFHEVLGRFKFDTISRVFSSYLDLVPRDEPDRTPKCPLP
jgi:polysaccharide deacetylase family protein (PEP-CTERM system associated)